VKLTKSFTLAELSFSQTAKQSDIHNEPGEKETEALRQLAVNILQPVRDYFKKPVIIRSGYRSAPLNRAVGGAPHSQHMYGQAADITIPGAGNDIIWQYIVDNLPLFDQCILEHCPASQPLRGWVHVSYQPNGRGEALSCPKAGVTKKGLVYAS